MVQLMSFTVNKDGEISNKKEWDEPNYVEVDIGVVVEYLVSTKKQYNLYTDMKAIWGDKVEEEMQNLFEEETKVRFPEYENTVTKVTLVK